MPECSQLSFEEVRHRALPIPRQHTAALTPTATPQHCRSASDRCDWHPSAYLCTEQGAAPPCEAYADLDSCVEHSDRCQYTIEAHMCHPIGVPLACSQFYDVDACEEQE